MFPVPRGGQTEWCAPPQRVRGEKKGGGEKRAVASNATTAALLFPFFCHRMQCTIPPATTGAGGISSVQQQASQKPHERSLRNFIQHSAFSIHNSALKRILVLVEDGSRTSHMHESLHARTPLGFRSTRLRAVIPPC